MPIVRRRKFCVQNETRGMETKYENLKLQTRQQAYNEQNNSTFIELENNGILRTENKNVVSELHINKSTSTIRENHISKNPYKEKNQSNNKTTMESRGGKKRCISDKPEQHLEKPSIHKVKVRNSKHKTFALGISSKHIKSVGSCNKSGEEIEDNSQNDNTDNGKFVKELVPRTSCKAMCRICHGGDSVSEFGQLVSACLCRGTIGKVHVVCLETWLTESGKSRCELCSTSYSIRRVHKYGILRALTIWLLSQNSKQLMFDMLGTILMMPLAILAAWLSGTTLLNLMAQEDEMAAWPLVSSFMLSCTTLVCYYCWIVSAATRHAIGWWIWYQSQYEVKLQLHTNPYFDDDYIIPGNA